MTEATPAAPKPIVFGTVVNVLSPTPVPVMMSYYKHQGRVASLDDLDKRANPSC